MIAQTYSTSLDNGRTEYGFTFKLSEDSDDCEFDIVLGQAFDEEIILQGFDDFRETAEKIARALTEN